LKENRSSHPSPESRPPSFFTSPRPSPSLFHRPLPPSSPTAARISSVPHSGPDAMTFRHTASLTWSSGGIRLQCGLGVDLSQLKSSIWDQRLRGLLVLVERVRGAVGGQGTLFLLSLSLWDGGWVNGEGDGVCGEEDFWEGQSVGSFRLWGLGCSRRDLHKPRVGERSGYHRSPR
jgi:hypothetical protein